MAIHDPSEPVAAAPARPNRAKRAAFGLGLVLAVLVLYDSASGETAGIARARDPVPVVTATPDERMDDGQKQPPPKSEVPNAPEEPSTPARSAAATPAARGDEDTPEPLPPGIAPGEKDQNIQSAQTNRKITSSVVSARKAGADERCDSLGVCRPFVLRSGSLFVQLKPDGEREPELFRTGAMKVGTEGQPTFSLGPQVRHVIVDIGTNMDPDTVTDFWDNSSVGFLWFEPQKTLLTHPMHLSRTRNVISMEHNRVVALPAAVAPENGMTKLYISATHGCTSLLPMNPKALEDSSVMKNSFKGGDKTFRDWSTSKIGFVNCIKKNNEREYEWVPTVKGTDVMRLIDPTVNVLYISVDAQGFDLQVTASFGKLAVRADMIMLECQDLPHGHGMFLTKGSFSCAEVRHCIESQLPHRMVAGATGLPDDTCTINNPSEERNCMFRRMDRPYFRLDKLPYLVRRDKYKLRYGVRDNLVCPSFDHE